MGPMPKETDYILLIEQDFPEYRLEIFNRLADRISPLGLRVAFGALNKGHFHRAPELKRARFQYEEMEASWFVGGRILWLNYFKALKGQSRPKAVVVRHSIRSPLLVPFMFWCRGKSIPVVVWGQGFSRRRRFNPRGNILDWLNLRIVRMAGAYVAYSEAIKSTLQQYVTGEHVYVGSNTLNLRGLDEDLAALRRQERSAVRKELGMEGAFHLIFVGRLQKRKKPDVLIRALIWLSQTTGQRYVLTMVGQGEEELPLRQLTEQARNIEVRFAGSLSVDDPRLIQRLYASDLMVIPGWLGLAVNHAFYCELPVVTVSKSMDMNEDHPPEAAYLQHEVNGVVDTTGTVAGLGLAIEYGCKHRNRLSEGARRTYHDEMDIDIMIDAFVQALRQVGALETKAGGLT